MNPGAESPFIKALYVWSYYTFTLLEFPILLYDVGHANYDRDTTVFGITCQPKFETERNAGGGSAELSSVTALSGTPLRTLYSGSGIFMTRYPAAVLEKAGGRSAFIWSSVCPA